MDSALLQSREDVVGGAVAAERSRDAFQVLAYNQDLVQFVDSKAGTLIVVNSLFIAASTASGGGVLARGLEVACLLCGGVAILACLRVVLAGRRPQDSPRKRPDVVFFHDIRRRQRPGHYLRDFVDTSDEELASQVLLRTYVVAGIAGQKFAAYALARGATAFAAIVWILARGILALAA
jgi:hypothetical protein